MFVYKLSGCCHLIIMLLKLLKALFLKKIIETKDGCKFFKIAKELWESSLGLQIATYIKY